MAGVVTAFALWAAGRPEAGLALMAAICVGTLSATCPRARGTGGSSRSSPRKCRGVLGKAGQLDFSGGYAGRPADRAVDRPRARRVQDRDGRRDPRRGELRGVHGPADPQVHPRAADRQVAVERRRPGSAAPPSAS